jgi:hypothetical protein
MLTDLKDQSIVGQVEKDLMRTFPTNVHFNTMEAEGTQRLRRVLLTTAWTIPEVGYVKCKLGSSQKQNKTKQNKKHKWL